MTRPAAAIIIGLSILLSFLVLGNNSSNKIIATIGSKNYVLENADTEEKQIQGLSTRTSMSQNSGMLFTFAKPYEACMWMKGMQFPLDMIWLNSEKQVVMAEQNVLPDTYPEAFCSAAPAKYVIELNSGQINKNGLGVGQQVIFKR